MYLKELIEKAGVKCEVSKKLLAAVVMETLTSNQCGITGDNQDEVRRTVFDGICDDYEARIFILAASWSNDAVYEMIEAENLSWTLDNFFKDLIWPYLREHEVMPGVKMTN